MSSVFPRFSYRLILASSSPRRRELLGHLGLPFTVAVPNIVEEQQPGETAAGYALRNAREKAEAVISQDQGSQVPLVIAADTIGVIGARILEKPRDQAEAEGMLRLLSGRDHVVCTALAVASRESVLSQLVETRVRFKVLTAEEIAYYVSTREPFDKAGGYGIQGIGGFMVERIEGSYSNVVGLPLVELIDLLKRFHGPLS